ncbi:hypothetical protein KW797_00900 [Candidatus Parcubacteria bacterium]|nr:hypothetical protein [Candidatus Parcubacteria bacterium]
MELQPQSNEMEALGLSPDEYAEELDSKEALLQQLTEGLEDQNATSGETTGRIDQLIKSIEEPIGKMKTRAQFDGGMLDLVGRMDGILEKAKELRKRYSQ